VVSDVVAKYPIIRPIVAFTVMANGSETARTFGKSKHGIVPHALWGVDISEAFITLNCARMPGVYSVLCLGKGKLMAAIFINGRLVEHERLIRGLEDVHPNLQFGFVILTMP
jgi:DNA mismatch repair ATPase MutL